MDCVSIALASAVPVVLVLGLWSRTQNDKGIGWQFIRFTVIAISLPITGLLAYNDALTGEAATIIAASLGYVFAKPDDRNSTKKIEDQ